jgi:hypothetical protein
MAMQALPPAEARVIRTPDPHMKQWIHRKTAYYHVVFVVLLCVTMITSHQILNPVASPPAPRIPTTRIFLAKVI